MEAKVDVDSCSGVIQLRDPETDEGILGDPQPAAVITYTLLYLIYMM
jgi:hypothetical protein